MARSGAWLENERNPRAWLQYLQVQKRASDATEEVENEQIDESGDRVGPHKSGDGEQKAHAAQKRQPARWYAAL